MMETKFTGKRFRVVEARDNRIWIKAEGGETVHKITRDLRGKFRFNGEEVVPVVATEGEK